MRPAASLKTTTRAFSLTALIFCASGCEKQEFSISQDRENYQTLGEAREGFSTRLIKRESGGDPVETPPEGIFNLIHYPSRAGNLAAYVSPEPGDGEIHPVVIWLTGGFGNDISSLPWAGDVPFENDQSASAYRKAGIAMMYPSLRGGNDNPGWREGLFGEVDDVLAAADYAASLSWVDPTRIYLGGHSTGGTLALLAAEAARSGRFRAVFAFGPVAEVADYGQESLPFDITNARECDLRAPLRYLDSISCPTFVMEGEMGNSASLEALRKRSRNRKLTFVTVKGMTHFSILNPANTVLAAKIAADDRGDCRISVSESEIQSSALAMKDTNFISPGDVRGDYAISGVVFYDSTEPKVSPADLLKEVAGKAMKSIPIVSSFKDAPHPPFFLLFEEKAPLTEYPVPDEDALRFSGRGMSDADIEMVQSIKRATILGLVTPGDGVWKNVKAFNRIAWEVSRRSNAFIFDNATRECFPPDAWKRKRIDQWGEGEIPDIRSQVTIHLYPRGDGSGRLRAITLGMEKFALPDVAVERLISSDNSAVGSLINVFCQTLATNPVVEDPANMQLSLDSLEPIFLRKVYRDDLLKKGTGRAVVAVMGGTPDEGDPENQQISLDFRHGDGASEDERRSSLLSDFWGSADSMVRVRHNEEIEKASKEAKLKFLAFKREFKSGLEPGGRLMVKAPFDTDDGGTEWMWLELVKWGDDNLLTGILQNDPYYIKKLKAGTESTVKADQIFDFVFHRPDGSTEGNETGKLIEQNSVEGRGKGN